MRVVLIKILPFPVLIVLLVLCMFITGCVTDPCATSPGSISCNKHEAAKLVRHAVLRQCRHAWKEMERDIGHGVTVYKSCGSREVCCLHASRAAARRVTK